MNAHDVLVYGATPGGIAAAVRAARDGLRVALVERSGHLGGFLTSGLGVMDTMYDGHRAALYDEFCDRVLDYYRNTYGEDSPQYRDAAADTEWPLRVEPHVAALLIHRWLSDADVYIYLNRPLAAVERAGRRLDAIWVDAADGRERMTAATFIDATYEADLAAAAGAPYRVGREDRREYDEPHAGRIFTKQVLSLDGLGKWPAASNSGAMNLRQFKSVSQEIYAGSTGVGDHRVQAYSFRVTLCTAPANRVIPGQPDGYDPQPYRAVDTGRPIGKPNLPNGKRFWFRNLTGGSEQYPDATEPEREQIRATHRAWALGYLYFLQNDPTVPALVRAEAREYGLAADEYVDNSNFPYEFYVREARRIVGDYVFTEHDASIAAGLDRAPVHADSIGFAEWFLDSHEVSDETQPGSSQEGKILLTELTRPSQIPFRILFAKDLDNLIVPVCMSATHVGWGTLRLEPVWMHTGEVAGRVASIAAQTRTSARRIDVDRLQRSLVSDRVAVTFFNDVDIANTDPATSALQYFGTRGFFPSYDARPSDPLTEPVARVWASAWAQPQNNDQSAHTTATLVRAADTAGEPVTAGRFGDLVRAAALINGGEEPDLRSAIDHPDIILTRAAACQILFDLHPHSKSHP